MDFKEEYSNAQAVRFDKFSLDDLQFIIETAMNIQLRKESEKQMKETA